MNRLLRNILFSFILIHWISGIQVSAMPEVNHRLRYDSAKIEIRLPSKEIFSEYYTDRRFNYGEEPNLNRELGFWLKLWLRIGKFLQKASFLLKAIPLLFKILLLAVAILFLYILITKTKLYSVFYSDTNLNPVSFTEEDIIEPIVDIDGQIEAEIRSQNFRLATRFMFIKLLHLLDKKQLIELAKGKTNFDYKSELAGTNLADDFDKSVAAYEYVWYGNFLINKINFESLSVCFTNLYRQLRD